jgi:hypothetical protein
VLVLLRELQVIVEPLLHSLASEGMSAPMASRTVQLAARTVAFPSSDLMELNDSSDLLHKGDFDQLRSALKTDGYLYLKQALNRDTVLAARSMMLEKFASMGGILDPAEPPQKGTLLARCGLGCVPFLEGKNDVTHDPLVQSVIAGEALENIMEKLLGEPVLSFEYKWLRAMPRESFTGVHCDNVYMARGSKRLHTVWIPFDDATTELGALALCQGSHRLPGFEKLQHTYAEVDVERDKLAGTGWFTTDPWAVSKMDSHCQWRTTDFKAGDIVIFGIRLLHASTANLTDRVRISCDVRWQPAADPVDPRYMDPAQKRQVAGAWAKDEDKGASEKVTMEQLKEKWGFEKEVL